MSNLIWKYTYNKISTDEVLEVGREIGYVFPQDFAECTAENNGGHVKPYEFEVSGKEHVFGPFFSFDRDDEEFIVTCNADLTDTLPEGLVAFDIDPSGNLICFDCKNRTDNPIVVFWEHDGAWEKSMIMQKEGLSEAAAEERARENVFFIADSFTDFLNKLHD